MEAEMQKQRARTLDILAEKENELQVTKSILASVRSQQNLDPMDPAQDALPRSVNYRKSSSRDIGDSSAPCAQRRRSAEFRSAADRSLSDAGSYSSVVEEHRLGKLKKHRNA
ncbi:unnamed protein product [Gongylonema pulchrum]|uniref:Uncharacterized protein n=1 Tax=Gongylonema pulchrum TaxID=637853 RepID=A0A183DGV9_9BILA|nr:unnamed protein product [Gongylonema pulchrum]